MLITQCEMLCRPAHVWIKSEGKYSSSAAKRDGLNHWNLVEKGPTFTVLVFPEPKILFVGQLWVTFQKSSSYTPE